MSQAPSTPYERLVAAAARLKVPDAVRAVATAIPANPEPGQIWRAAWQRTVELLVIVSVRDDTVHAIPMSLEKFHDERTLLLPAADSTLGQPVFLWIGLTADLPWCVLDRQLGRLTAPLPDYDSAPGSELPAGQRWGTAIPSPAAPAAEYRAALTDAITALQTAANWVPRGTGGLAKLFQHYQITPQQLADHLGMAPAQALTLWRGQIPVSPPQAHRLETLLGLPAAKIIEANPALPADLAQELSRPLRRWQLRQLAAHEHTSEDEARHRAAFEVFALAARQTSGTDPDWAGRADRYFQARLGQDDAW